MAKIKIILNGEEFLWKEKKSLLALIEELDLDLGDEEMGMEEIDIIVIIIHILVKPKCI